ncbi:MAG TPA: protein kinase, partial [Polyangia bacterium]
SFLKNRPPGTLVGGRFRIKQTVVHEPSMQLLRASDAQSGDDVALLVLRPDGPARALLEREVAKAQRLGGHKVLAAALGVVGEGQEIIIAHEWQDGHSLREIIDAHASKGETVGVQRAYTLLGHVATALEHAYSRLVHGGLHPGNIWVTSSGRMKVGGIGLTLAVPGLARAGGPQGAPPGLYLAPEVASGGEPTPASDVYSLGAILFELLAGVPPVPPLRPPSRIVAGVPLALDAVVGRALLPQPFARYATPSDFMRAFSEAIAAAEGSAPNPARTATPASDLPAAPAPGGPAASAATEPTTTPDAVRPFDVAAAAGLSQEDARWLIQKDKLDFGPFSLQQIKAQLEKGQFRGDNLIVDMDSGARQKIIEHPQLGDFARHAERRLEQARRVQAEHAHENVERKKSRVTLFVLGGAVIALVGGLGVYLANREAAKEGELATRVGEGDVDAFLKGVKVDFPTNKRPTTRRLSRGAGGKTDDPFSGVTNLGDVSQGGGEEILSDSAIQNVMMGNYRKLVPCIMDERRRNPGLGEMDLEFLVTGAGKVTAVKVNGQQKGPFPSCVLNRMASFPFPKYNGSRTIASWSMAMR